MNEETDKSDSAAAGEDASPPHPTFRHLVETFAVPALIWTGHLLNPVSEKAEPNLKLAQYQIGILELLEAKTKGNLTADEKDYLDEMLHAVRMAYLHACNLKRDTGKTTSPPTTEPTVS
ncbi:MAG: DUF1844 domain-containing protein [Candidatus Sumerlaeia bacterium]|nr:DUF1844 domain-containing protein [Candidatus Sumerlaeia bacterium]